MDNTVCSRCSVSKITQFRTCIFSKNIYIFRHFKLKIALAIPASNDEKYNWNNSAGQGLKSNLQLLWLHIYPLSLHNALQHHFTSLKRLNFPITKGFRTKISMKLFYQYMAIFINFLPTSNHLHQLQVENCDSNSRLVVDEDDNGKFRLERIKQTSPEYL